MKRTSPNTAHQRISRKLSFLFELFLRQNPVGEHFTAPYDVAFDEFELALPDVIFVSNANQSIIQRGCIEGTPDLLVEILSPGTAKFDRGEKMKLYRRFGVAEYWIVNPKSQSIEVHFLQNGDYDLVQFAEEKGEIESTVIAGFKIEVSQIFD